MRLELPSAPVRIDACPMVCLADGITLIALQAELAKRLSLPTERIPIIINGKEEWDGEGEIKQRMPTKHAHIIAKGTNATKEQVNRAIKSALKAKAQWESALHIHTFVVFY